jgi:hypothetical protein
LDFFLAYNQTHSKWYKKKKGRGFLIEFHDEKQLSSKKLYLHCADSSYEVHMAA